MENRIYITQEEAIKRVSFFVDLGRESSQYIFIKDFESDSGRYCVYRRKSGTLTSHRSTEDILRNYDFKYYVIKNSNINNY